MNSTVLGYILFVIAAYVLLILGTDVTTVEALQKQFVPDNLTHYIHLPGVVFVFLGVTASVLISYNFSEIWKAARSLYLVYFRNKINFNWYLDAITNIAQYTNTHDVESLEEYANQIKYPFMRDGLLMLVNGYKKEEIRDVLQVRIENESFHDQIEDDVFRSAAAYSPGYGMLGTTVGLIQMFSTKIDAAAGFAPILTGLAVAFTTTLYGLFLSNFVFQPFSDKIERRTEVEVLLKTMIMDGLCLISEKKHPIYIQDKLATYIHQSRTLGVPKIAQLSVEGA
jgi:chemotaxis protein MotA